MRAPRAVRLLTRVLTAALAASGAMAAAADADYADGAELMSAHEQRLEQGDDASLAPAISADGRFMAFETRAGNFFDDDDPDPPGRFRRGGIFRRDLGSGRLELVAEGDFVDEDDPAGPPVLQGAHNPSTSGNGRYVVFSTVQRLVPADTNDNADVYRRDMNVPIRLPGAFTLVSARDGSELPATYGPPARPQAGRNPGAEVWPLEAISADGRRVVFRTVEVASDLPASANVDTPQGQLFVRDIAAQSTRLVTRRADDASVPAGGAEGPAVISDDGSTVAWTGINARFQTRFFAGESTSSFIAYYLWQRIDDGSSAPTRRVTGATDPDDPGCPPDSEVAPIQTATGPCYGPLTGSEGSRTDVSTRTPALSADGRRVAFLVSTGPRPNDQTGNGLDAWVTDMSQGVSRKAGSRELTREGGQSDPRAGTQIDGLALSGDGRWLALSTSRASFVLGSPRPIGSFLTFATERDVVMVDLEADTLERVTRGYDGRDTAGSAASGMSLSADGVALAFASAAPNLFFGDANEQQDAFLARRIAAPRPVPPPVQSEPPPPVVTDETPPAPPRLSVRQKRLRNGSVRLTVRTPLSGRLQAVARGRVRTTASRRRPPLRSIARARADADRPGEIVLHLKLGRAYRKVLARTRRVRSTTKVTLAPQLGGRALTRTVSVLFTLPRKPRR